MKRMDPQYNRDSTPSQQAAHWWLVLNDEGCTAADRKHFADWVQRSPERVEAFLRVSMLTQALHSGRIHWPETSAEELIQQARSNPAEVIPMLGLLQAGAAPARSRDPSPRRRALMLLVAGLATLCITALLISVRESPDHYRTMVGEQRSVLLEDGSIVTLNTASEIAVDYGEQRRFIRMVSGEALFTVAHDEQRPFDVAAGSVVVRAVGTQFNVDRRADRTTVTVMEGKVRVSSQMSSSHGEASGSSEPPAPLDELVVAAQRVVVTESGIGRPEQVRNVAPVTAWVQRQLVFENRPLSEVTAEFNRYNRRHIVIESAALRERQVTGVFQANDAASFLAFISGIPGVSVGMDEAGNHVVSMGDRSEAAVAGGGPN
jgi:transmembrane sensor